MERIAIAIALAAFALLAGCTSPAQGDTQTRRAYRMEMQRRQAGLELNEILRIE